MTNHELLERMTLTGFRLTHAELLIEHTYECCEIESGCMAEALYLESVWGG